MSRVPLSAKNIHGMLRCFVSFGRCTGSTDHIHDEAHVSGAREGFVSRPRTQCGRSLQLIEPVLCVMNLPGHLSVRCCQSAPIDLRMLCLCRHSVLNAGARFASSLPPTSASGTATTTGPRWVGVVGVTIESVLYGLFPSVTVSIPFRSRGH